MGFRRKLALGWTSQGGKSRWAGSASVLPSRRLEADSGLATWRPSKLVQPLAETLAKMLALHPENLIAVVARDRQVCLGLSSFKNLSIRSDHL